jgi:uncharacterized cupredoxin-like copper-binding protein
MALHPGSSLAFALAATFLAGCAGKPVPAGAPAIASSAVDWSRSDTVAVDLTDFKFSPSRLVFAAGRPVRLLLTNGGSGRHDFSAPAFFAAASFRPGGAAPADGAVSLDKGQSAEIDLIPSTPGRYPLECAEFLHDMFGMTGEITVTAGGS